MIARTNDLPRNTDLTSPRAFTVCAAPRAPGAGDRPRSRAQPCRGTASPSVAIASPALLRSCCLSPLPPSCHAAQANIANVRELERKRTYPSHRRVRPPYWEETAGPNLTYYALDDLTDYETFCARHLHAETSVRRRRRSSLSAHSYDDPQILHQRLRTETLGNAFPHSSLSRTSPNGDVRPLF